MVAAWAALGHSFIAPIPGAPICMGILGHVSLLLLTFFMFESSRRYFKRKIIFGGYAGRAVGLGPGPWVFFNNSFLGGGAEVSSSRPATDDLFDSQLDQKRVHVPVEKRKNVNRLGIALAGLFIGLMAGGNFNQVLGPQSHMENSPNFMRARWISQTLHPDDVFLFAGGSPDSITNVYIAYFAPQVLARSVRGYYFGRPHGDLSELRQLVQSVRQPHQRVFVEAGLYDPKIKRTGSLRPGAAGHAPNLAEQFGIKKVWIGFGFGRLQDL